MSAEPARRAAVGVVTLAIGGALFLAAPPTSALDDSGRSVRAEGPLVDLATTSDPTDGAQARVTASPADGAGTTVVLHVRDLKPLGDRRTLGAHVHVGGCVAGNPAAAGPHWRTAPTAQPSDRTEVWLDITVTPGGTGTAVAHVREHYHPWAVETPWQRRYVARFTAS